MADQRQIGASSIPKVDRLASLTKTLKRNPLIFKVRVPRPATGQTEKREDFQREPQKNDIEIILRHHCKPSKTAPILAFAADTTEASAKAGLKCWWTE